MSPPAKMPEWPVIMSGPTITVPSDLNSTPGTLFRKPLSVCWPSASTTASASSVSNWPVGCGLPSASSSVTSTVSDGPTTSLMLVSHLILTPSASASSRSEEHTSELQSLMRISYAVFCLKKQNTYKKTHQSQHPKLTHN